MEYKSKLDYETGFIVIRGNEDGITSVSYEESLTPCNDISNQWTEQAKQELTEYFQGRRKEFDLPLIFQGTQFQNAVWQALLTIPYGTTVSYKEVCKRSGRERAYQAVGTAIGKNPFLILAPCHRVIASDGSIGGFALGIDFKRRLLSIEGRNE